MIANRKKRHSRLRKKISGTSSKPRLAVFRSLKGMYVQLIDDEKSITIIGVSDKVLKSDEITKKRTKKESAYQLGKLLAEAAKEKNISHVVFDRGGNLYHGRVEEFARGAREGGLIF